MPASLAFSFVSATSTVPSAIATAIRQASPTALPRVARKRRPPDRGKTGSSSSTAESWLPSYASARQRRRRRYETAGWATGRVLGPARAHDSLSERIREVANVSLVNFKALEQNHEAKLPAVEVLFQRCGNALKELQQVAFAAPAARAPGPPSEVDPPELAAFRGRVDEIIGDAVKERDRLTALDDHFVSCGVNFEAFCTDAEGLVEKQYETAQAVGFIRADGRQRFALAVQQFADLERTVAEGACKCPASCPGSLCLGVQAKSQQAPRLEAIATSPNAPAASAAPEPPKPCRWQDPFTNGRDAWSRSQKQWQWHGSGCGGGGGGGGGGGDGG